MRQEAGYCTIAWKADTADTKTFDVNISYLRDNMITDLLSLYQLSGGANRMTSSVSLETSNWKYSDKIPRLETGVRWRSPPVETRGETM